MTTTILIDDSGRLSFLWDDELAGLCELGETEMQRASHVEYWPHFKGGGWCADLSPVGGPLIGPFKHRGDALRSEHDWINRNLFAEPLTQDTTP
jgi:hypothetical protein